MLDYCKYCGVSFQRVSMGAPICLCGGRSSNDPNYCQGGPGHKHSFAEDVPEPTEPIGYEVNVVKR